MSGDHFSLGLIGWPLEHSLSPMIHAAALSAGALEGVYNLYPIEPLPAGTRALKAILADLRDGEVDGLNVTLPHKQSVLSQLDRLTSTAEAIGAVNTVLREGDELIGENTDMEGFLRDLALTLSPEVGGALILGGGGAARAVAYGLLKAEWEVWVATRRVEQALELTNSMRALGCHSIHPNSLELAAIESILMGVTLIVNATPVGMAPNSDASPWPSGLPFPQDAMIYDLVYVPQETTLVRLASKSGLRATTGLGMLVEQAALAFELWTGREAPRAAMRSVAQSSYAQSSGSEGV